MQVHLLSCDSCGLELVDPETLECPLCTAEDDARRFRDALERIAARRPNQSAAAAAFYRSRQDAQEALRHG